jgi:antitoxin (DNA-binding transcriptional repressor) of toxin-antitoxin stability system
MKTITTRQLREEMPAVVKALRMGTPVRLTYRHAVIGTIQPTTAPAGPARRGSPEAIQDFLTNSDLGYIPPRLRKPGKSFKEEIAELRDKDL